MDFRLSEEEQMLQSSARKLFESLGGIQAARDYTAGKEESASLLWNRLAELGYAGILVPEDDGGMDLEFTSVIPLAEELGRTLAPIPFMETVVFGAMVLLKRGTSGQKAAWLPKIADGSLRLGVCAELSEPSVSDMTVPIAAERRDSGFVLSGEMDYVRYGKDANAYVVAADLAGEHGRAIFLVDRQAAGIHAASCHTLDQTGPSAKVCFERVHVGDDALIGGQLGTDGLQDALDAMNAALCANMVGGMSKVVEMAAEYAQIRHQFGHPIGRYQAIKHRIADMKVETEIARSLAYYAALAVQEQLGEAGRIVSSAKSYCSEAYERIASHNIQIHGGIGFTTEHDAHLFLKRAKEMERYGGSAVQHRKRVADQLDGRHALKI